MVNRTRKWKNEHEEQWAGKLKQGRKDKKTESRNYDKGAGRKEAK